MTQHIRVTAAVLLLSILGMVAFVFVDATPGTAAAQARGFGHGRAPHGHHVRRRHHPNLFGVTRRMMAMAEKVSICEEGGDWHYVGSVFDGGIGWTLENWAEFRKPTWPHHMHQAPPRMQANALFRFVRHYHMAMPDQSGVCAGY